MFGGTGLLALLLVALAPWLSGPERVLPPWGFLVFVVLVDVAHVYTTVFRTYFDAEELRRRPVLYAVVPLACFGIGCWLYARGGPLTFWRFFAYAALFHFIRQQVGWVAIYRAKAREHAAFDRYLDSALIYLATGVPVLYWHAHLPKPFQWFVPGDFISWPGLRTVIPAAFVVYGLVATTYVARAWQQHVRGHALNVGKHVVVLATASTWMVGIVLTSSDFEFTVANVIVHGVPYGALLWAYTRERAKERPTAVVGRVAGVGLAAFIGVVWLFALFEEALWDQLVWHQHQDFFGEAWLAGWLGGTCPEATIGVGLGAGCHTLEAIVVAALIVPQATHYVLDAFLWRRGDTGPAQARALGFAASGKDATETAPDDGALDPLPRSGKVST